MRFILVPDIPAEGRRVSKFTMFALFVFKLLSCRKMMEMQKKKRYVIFDNAEAGPAYLCMTINLKYYVILALFAFICWGLCFSLGGFAAVKDTDVRVWFVFRDCSSSAGGFESRMLPPAPGPAGETVPTG